MIRYLTLGAALSALATVALSSPVKAWEYRTTIDRYGSQITVTTRAVTRDDGIRYVPQMEEDEVRLPNACDQKGIGGFEVLSGPRKGCFASQF